MGKRQWVRGRTNDLSPRTLTFLFSASGCRFYCRFSMPFLVAVWRSKITLRYNTANQIADVEGIGELKLVSSLIAHHSSFFLSAPRFTAFLLLSFRSIAFLCSSAVKVGFPASCFPLLLSHVIAEKLIRNCQLNQLVVRSAPAFALYLQEIQ